MSPPDPFSFEQLERIAREINSMSAVICSARDCSAHGRQVGAEPASGDGSVPKRAAGLALGVPCGPGTMAPVPPSPAARILAHWGDHSSRGRD